MAIAVAPGVRELAQDDRYTASTRGPELVRLPEITFVMVDGRGDPNTSAEYRDAIQTLYSLSYTLKFALKKELGLIYRVGALEGLWWADDMTEFWSDRKADWRWTAMIAQPDAVTPAWFARAVEEVARKKGPQVASDARLERFAEGICGQILHIGPYGAEAPTIARLHAFILELGGRFDGRFQKHHEIYLGDPRRSAPEKLRTIIRQPMTRRHSERMGDPSIDCRR